MTRLSKGNARRSASTSRPRTRLRPADRSADAKGQRAPKPAQHRDDAPTCAVSCVDVAATSRARAALPPAIAINALAETLRALGDSTRLRLVAALGTPGVKELCVCDLASLVGVSQSAVSHSLRVLRDLRLVQARRVGKIAFYALDDGHVADLLRTGFAHVDEQVGSTRGRGR